MDPNRLMLAQDEFNAHVLRGVMGATGLPGGEAAGRPNALRLLIVEVFHSFEALDPVEAMIACHCISLRFMLDAAMRDAGDAAAGPAPLCRSGCALRCWRSAKACIFG